jgi:hypothetical protein
MAVARRDNTTKMAHMNYETITRYSGIDRGRIRSAVSLLAALGLVHVERLPSAANSQGIANGYRLSHLNPYVHMGTRGRGMDAAEFAE